jgi:hypothetical protein
MKNITQVKVLGAMIALMTFASTAQASRRDLINGALNASLQERSEVQASYETNPAAVRPDDNSRRNRRIEIEVGFTEMARSNPKDVEAEQPQVRGEDSASTETESKGADRSLSSEKSL